MPLVFFSKTFQKNSCTAYTIKKNRTKLPTKKKNSCRGNFSAPLPGYLMVYPLINYFNVITLKCMQDYSDFDKPVQMFFNKSFQMSINHFKCSCTLKCRHMSDPRKCSLEKTLFNIKRCKVHVTFSEPFTSSPRSLSCRRREA